MALVPPESLKRFVSSFLKRADELEALAIKDASYARMAYQCRVYAATSALKMLGTLTGNDHATAQAFIDLLLNKLESDKRSFGINESDQMADLTRLTAFAMTVFKRAEQEDLAGTATKATALLYLEAGNYLDVVRGQGGGDPKIDSIAKYVKGRANEIVQSINAGMPVPPLKGGSNADVEALLAASLSDPATVPPPSTSNNAFYSMPPVPVGASPSAPAAYGAGSHSSRPSPSPPTTAPSFHAPSTFTPSHQVAPSAPAHGSAPSDVHAAPFPGYGGYPAASPALQSNVSSSSLSSLASSMGRSKPSKAPHDVPPDVMHDATEYTKHALAAFRTEEPDLAVEYLRKALWRLGQK